MRFAQQRGAVSMPPEVTEQRRQPLRVVPGKAVVAVVVAVLARPM